MYNMKDQTEVVVGLFVFNISNLLYFKTSIPRAISVTKSISACRLLV